MKSELQAELDAANELRRALGAETARADGLERERNRAKREKEACDKKTARWKGACEFPEMVGTVVCGWFSSNHVERSSAFLC